MTDDPIAAAIARAQQRAEPDVIRIAMAAAVADAGSGIVYVMRVSGEANLCKVGYTMRTVAERFPKWRYNGRIVEPYMEHRFHDAIVAEREVHSLLAWCRVGRDELFEISPERAWGAVLWYAGEVTLRPPAPGRELRLYRTACAERVKERAYAR